MSKILLHQLKEFISPSLISKLCNRYEESEIVLRKSIEVAICTVLMGVYNAVEVEEDMFENMLDSITQSKFYRENFENPKTLSLNNSFESEGEIPLLLLFSNKKGRISEMISNEVIVKSETASAVFNLSGMLVLSYFRKQNLSNQYIRQILEEQKKMMLNRIPEGIRIILGFSLFECTEEFSVSTEEDKKAGLVSTVFNFFLNQKQLI